MPATSRRVYQTSMLRISAKCAIASRYSRTAVVDTERRVGLVEASIPTRDREARREPLHVPLERPRQRLVEVVDAEDEPPVRRREDAEVREVRVAAELRVQARSRPIREVGRHQVGGAAEEGERRSEHAPVPDRAELGQSRSRLLLEQLDRVSAHRPRLPRRRATERGSSLRAALPRAARSAGVKWGTAVGPDALSPCRLVLVEDMGRGLLGSRRGTRVRPEEFVIDVRHRLAPFACSCVGS